MYQAKDLLCRLATQCLLVPAEFIMQSRRNVGTVSSETDGAVLEKA